MSDVGDGHEGTSGTAGDEPVRRIPGDPVGGPQGGTALCLSGGGYRAMLFHAGVLWRLNDAGLLPSFDRVSSVSGGSITAAVLGLHWDRLDVDERGHITNFVPVVIDTLRHMAEQHVDVLAVLGGALTPFVSISDRVVKAYRKHLFGDATLQDLPERPRFVINATNVESGVLFRFSRPYIADYRVGMIDRPTVSLAEAVAASSAFPPVLSPFELDLRDAEWRTEPGNDLTDPGYRGKVTLTDGGVYDNLGLETAWKTHRTVLVSDGGGGFTPEPDPAGDWARHTVRVMKVIDNQVRALRKRQVVQGFLEGDHEGAYVSIRGANADYPLDDPIPADPAVTEAIAAIPTRLDRMDDRDQEMLINWGYAMTDTGLRSHWPVKPPKGTLPYPDRPLV